MKKRYVGPNEVSGVSIEEYKTPGGKEVVKIFYEGEVLPPEIMPMATFEKIVTDVPKDYNWLRETRYENLVNELAAVALEHDISFSDIEHVVTALKKKFGAAFDRATNVLWTGDDAQFIPGLPPLAYRTLLEADRVMKDRIKPNETGTSTDAK